MDREIQQFRDDHPRSLALFERATNSLLAGVPMNWMVQWAGGFPIFVETASGAHFTDVDGHEYIDFCLGDTGAMAGHGAPATVAAVERQVHGRGITTCCRPRTRSGAARSCQRRFGLPYWQFTLTATDANRFAIRLARHGHRPAQDRRPRLLLPRLGRRDDRDPGPRRPGRRARGQHRARRSTRP